MNEYWEQAFIEALDQIGFAMPSSEDIVKAGKILRMAHESYSEVSGELNITNPIVSENVDLKKKLEREKNKRHCKHCNGSGRLFEGCGGSHYSDTSCWKCNGTGWIYL